MQASSKEVNAQDDALIMVHLRNNFYKKKFHFALGIYVLTLVVIAFLVGVLVFILKNPTHPLYFVTDDVGRLIQDIPRQSPGMSTDDAANWAIEAVENTMSYDYVNYRAQIQNSQKYFNAFGWRNYMSGLTATNNLLALAQRKMVVIAKVVDRPTVKVQGILAGAYAWKFEMPVLVTYLTPPFGDKNKFSNPLYVTVIVQRQSVISSYKGLAIVQMIGNLAMGSPTQNLSAPPS